MLPLRGRVDLIMAMKGYSKFSNSLRLETCHQIVLCHIQDTHILICLCIGVSLTSFLISCLFTSVCEGSVFFKGDDKKNLTNSENCTPSFKLYRFEITFGFSYKNYIKYYCLYIYIYIWPGFYPRSSTQRLKKWYLMTPCLTLRNIR